MSQVLKATKKPKPNFKRLEDIVKAVEVKVNTIAMKLLGRGGPPGKVCLSFLLSHSNIFFIINFRMFCDYLYTDYGILFYLFFTHLLNLKCYLTCKKNFGHSSVKWLNILIHQKDNT